MENSGTKSTSKAELRMEGKTEIHTNNTVENDTVLSDEVVPNSKETDETNNETESTLESSKKNSYLKSNTVALTAKSYDKPQSNETADSNNVTKFNTVTENNVIPDTKAENNNTNEPSYTANINNTTDNNVTTDIAADNNDTTEQSNNEFSFSTESNNRSESEPQESKVNIQIEINKQKSVAEAPIVDKIKIEDDIKTEEALSSSVREFQLNLRPKRAEKRRYADLSEANIELNAELEFKQRCKELKVRDRTGQGFKPPTKHKMKIQTDGPPYLCNLCPFKTEQKVAYSNHIRYHQRKYCTKFKCLQCTETFNTNNELRAHKTTHNSKDQTFMCQKCQEAFSNHLDYAIHNIIHSRPPFKCNECGLKFPRPSNLALHLQSHVIQEKIPCKLCGSKISAKKYETHVRRHKTMITHECVECGKTLKSKKDLATHMSVHTGVRKYQCWYCGRCCLSSQSREKHLKVHSTERPFSCNICGRAFKEDDQRVKHEESHTRTKDFECDICKKRFKSKWCVVMHMRMHLNFKPYSCADCDEKFCTLPSYKNHMDRVHIGKKDFHCKVCSTSYYTMSGLKRHCNSNIHKNKLYLVQSLAGNLIENNK